MATRGGHLHSKQKKSIHPSNELEAVGCTSLRRRWKVAVGLDAIEGAIHRATSINPPTKNINRASKGILFRPGVEVRRTHTRSSSADKALHITDECKITAIWGNKIIHVTTDFDVTAVLIDQKRTHKRIRFPFAFAKLVNEFTRQKTSFHKSKG